MSGNLSESSNEKTPDHDSGKADIDIVESTHGKVVPHVPLEELTGLLYRWLIGDKTPSKKERLYPYAFEIDEEFIERLDTRVRERFDRLVTWSPNVDHVSFSAEVGFSDLSAQRFDSIEEMFYKAADKHDPQRLTLTWTAALALSPGETAPSLGETAKVVAFFTTEKPLETEELGLLEFSTSSMRLEVAGSNREWVESTYDTLSPFFESVKIAGLYKPLLIFRNKAITMFVSFGSALIIQVFGQQLLFRLLGEPTNTARLNRVLEQPTLDDRFEEFVRIILGQADSSILQPVLAVGGGLILFLVVLILGYLLYPKLIPKSTIAVGLLASRRIAKYQNAFRFIVFTVLISGIIVPIILKLVGL